MSPASWSISRRPAFIPATAPARCRRIRLSAKTIAELERQTRALALALNVGGLMNVQYAIKNGDIYVLEVNPRASRTVPFVAKVTGLPVAKIAARVMAGETSASFKLKPAHYDHIGVKEAVFPFARFPGVDTVLGPEMKSTGEVMGLDGSFEIAFAKSQIGGGSRLPRSGTVFVSVRDTDKPRILDTIRLLAKLGFKVIATSGTQRFLVDSGIEAEKVNKVAEGRPHIVDAITNGQVQLVFNTTEGATSLADSKSLRRAALLHKVPYYTTLSGAVAAARGLKAYLGGDLEVRALQSYFTDLRLRADLTAPQSHGVSWQRVPRSRPGTVFRAAVGTFCFAACIRLQRISVESWNAGTRSNMADFVCAGAARGGPSGGPKVDRKNSNDRCGLCRAGTENSSTASRWNGRVSFSRLPMRARTAICRRTPNITPPRSSSRTTKAASPSLRTSLRAPT